MERGDCDAFWLYKEDLELKDFFFEELSKVKETWTRYADEGDKWVYTRETPGTSIRAVFYKFKVPTNMMKPI